MTFAQKLDRLLRQSDISAAELSRSLSYDPSFLSRIRSGQRTPQDLERFAQDVARFVARRTRDEQQWSILGRLLGTDAATLDQAESRENALASWLLIDDPVDENPARAFVEALDRFDINEFMSTMQIPTEHAQDVGAAVPKTFHEIKTASYSGIDGLREAELAFLSYALLAEPGGDIFMYSDMDMGDLAADTTFAKEWMQGLALVLKRGLRISIIHDIDRPATEMALGLQSWVPLYMTGMIRSFYLPGPRDNVFRHSLRVCDCAAAFGEGIAGAREHDRYILTQDSIEIANLRQRSEDILARARVLIDTYRESDREALEAFVEKERQSLQACQETLTEVAIEGFINTSFTIAPGKWVLIRKQKAPAIAFVIHHPKLRAAIEALAAGGVVD